jgi:hypothetical protein
MDYEERLINELKQIKHRKDINSGQHIGTALMKVLNRLSPQYNIMVI